MLISKMLWELRAGGGAAAVGEALIIWSWRRTCLARSPWKMCYHKLPKESDAHLHL